MFPIGTRVWNHRYGYGTITSERIGYGYMVQFDNGTPSFEVPHYLKVVRSTVAAS